MKTAESYEELAPLLSAQLRRGVVTNAALTAEDWRREADSHTLRYESWEGGLLLLRRRETHTLLNFYLRELFLPEDLAWDSPTLMEIAARPRDERLQQAAEFWRGQGFQELFRRKRITLPRGTVIPAGDSPLRPRAANRQDARRVWELLRANYDPMTGCLPTREELDRDLDGGNVLCVDSPEGEVAGILHIVRGPSCIQDRHLVIDPAYRRLGGAQRLLSFCAERTGFPRTVLWVGTDNAPALGLYDKIGYVADGWTSTVLCRP